ncbi:hypothetical protein [Sulfurisoma sediminicola]|uniref:Uncharacterized protein n=1 Tax=Sulfurisoma sediminicola TaxID=1381557 RepID=A0A497XEF8_9PROT|nr:hypothetical protein [Sulfurisoma sediminicola]RLJ65371.1 hypothetical protein DFR35_2035 [Sulfurisoma sediminicola]
MPVRRYALRRLNPYRGVTRVIELAEARAVSTDGANWELQVLTERPVGWGSLNLGRVETLYYRYGVWSAEEGVARYPMHPALERQRLHRAAERLVEALGAAPADEAEERGDRFECWLLDAAEQRPLALIAAVATAEAIPAHVSSRWCAAPGDAESLAGLGHERAEALERAVARRSGTHAWFQRMDDGSGRKVPPPASNQSGFASEGNADCRRRVVGAGATVTLGAKAFPELLLDEAWPDAETAAAVAAYVEWLAPRLLMLPLAQATRVRLERAAAAQADAVAHFFRLYPAVADTRLMNALRVQARLNQSAA